MSTTTHAQNSRNPKQQDARGVSRPTAAQETAYTLFPRDPHEYLDVNAPTSAEVIGSSGRSTANMERHGVAASYVRTAPESDDAVHNTRPLTRPGDFGRSPVSQLAELGAQTTTVALNDNGHSTASPRTMGTFPTAPKTSAMANYQATSNASLKQQGLLSLSRDEAEKLIAQRLKQSGQTSISRAQLERLVDNELRKAQLKQQELPFFSREETEKLIAHRPKQSGQKSISRVEFERLVENELRKAQLDRDRSEHGSQEPATNTASSRPPLYDRHSLPVLEDVRPGAMVRPELSTSDRYATGRDGNRSLSAGAISEITTDAELARNLLKVKITGATLDGNKRQSLTRPIKLDTASPENLISSSMRKDLEAEIIKDVDYLTGANHARLNVEGAAMVWLTWKGKSGEREELIYCLVVRDLTKYLIVSEDRNVTLFKELREAKGPWEHDYGRSVLTIELDELKRQEREELNRRRQATLARAQVIQAEKDKDRAKDRNRPGREALQERR